MRMHLNSNCARRIADIDMDYLLVQISSIGALLDHLTRERAVSDLDGEGLEGLDVRDIESVSL